MPPPRSKSNIIREDVTNGIGPAFDPPTLPNNVIQQFEEFAAPQPTLITVNLDSVTAYIQDSFNLTAAPITGVTGTISGNGNTTLTVSDGTGLAVGMGVSGRGIPVGATLASGGGTSWVLSIAAAAGSGVALTFTNIIVDLVHSAMQPNVSIDASTKPNSTTSPFYNMFPLEVVGDIVGINDDPTVTGLYLSKNFVSISSPKAAAATPTSTPINAGQMITDPPIKMTGFRHDIFKILYPDPADPTMPMEIGSITAAGISGKPVPPGGPLEITGGDWAITGGTGAFLGVTGQMGGGGGGGGVTRMASVTEDPSQRQANAPPNGNYAQTIDLYLFPLMPPQVVGVSHAAPPGQYLPPPVTYDNPASVGETLILYATGLGPVRYWNVDAWVDVPIGQGFPPDAAVISPVTVTIGDTTIPIEFQNAQGVPGFSNGYAVEFTVPSGFSPGELLPIQISSAWIQSAAVNMLYLAAG